MLGEDFGRPWEGVRFNVKITATPTSAIPADGLPVTLLIDNRGGIFVAGLNQNGIKTVTVTVPTAGSVIHTVATVVNPEPQGDGRVAFRLQAPSPPCTPKPSCTEPYIVGTPNSVSQEVLDRELPTLTISGHGRIPEGQDAIFDVVASPAPKNPLKVEVLVDQFWGNHVAQEPLGKREVTIEVPTDPLATFSSATISVPTVGDDDDEVTGLLDLALEVPSPTTYRLHWTINWSRTYIYDNDPPATETTPVVEIAAGPAVTEGDSDNEATFTVTASPAPTTDLTVNLWIAAGRGVVASSELQAKTVEIKQNTTEATYSVATLQNTDENAAGWVSAILDPGTGYSIHDRLDGATVTVKDDEQPGTPKVNITANQASVCEGNPAEFTVTVSPAPTEKLLVEFFVRPWGRYLAPTEWGPKVVEVGSTGSAPWSVKTVKDNIAEWNGSVTVSAALRDPLTYDVDNSEWGATVIIRDDCPTPGPRIRIGPRTNDDDPQPPLTEAPRRTPQPLQLALWTDSPGYRAGEIIHLYHTLRPHDDEDLYRTIVYLERAGGDERHYLAPLADGELHAEAVDARGRPLKAAVPRILYTADKRLIYEGVAPEPGLWQFVLELRPGPPGSQAEPRRAWARFVVAEHSQRLNRRGFDRELRADLTLRSDTLYYLGHQLFVHDGATLTIEPGTLVQAQGRHAAIIVEPGGRIVAEGTREAPVVLTCSSPVGRREPGCWAGLRLLGKGPVTRLQGMMPGVLPAERPVYGGADAEDSSGSLRYVRVEFAGASGDPEATLPAIGLYGVGSGTVLDHVQARESLGDGFAFHGGTAACDHCVASGSGHVGLSWDRGWCGSASHLYVQHGTRGLHGVAGSSDEQAFDRQPHSHPTLSNVTLVHSWPYGRPARKGIAVRLRHGSGLTARDLLATRFLRGAIHATDRAYLRFTEGESSVASALLWVNGGPQVPRGMKRSVQFDIRNPKLRDVRDFPNPDPRPKTPLTVVTLRDDWTCCIGAFDAKQNWLDSWTVFGPESAYDLRQRDDDDTWPGKARKRRR